MDEGEGISAEVWIQVWTWRRCGHDTGVGAGVDVNTGVDMTQLWAWGQRSSMGTRPTVEEEELWSEAGSGEGS